MIDGHPHGQNAGDIILGQGVALDPGGPGHVGRQQHLVADEAAGGDQQSQACPAGQGLNPYRIGVPQADDEQQHGRPLNDEALPQPVDQHPYPGLEEHADGGHQKADHGKGADPLLENLDQNPGAEGDEYLFSGSENHTEGIVEIIPGLQPEAGAGFPVPVGRHGQDDQGCGDIGRRPHGESQDEVDPEVAYETVYREAGGQIRGGVPAVDPAQHGADVARIRQVHGDAVGNRHPQMLSGAVEDHPEKQGPVGIVPKAQAQHAEGCQAAGHGGDAHVADDHEGSGDEHHQKARQLPGELQGRTPHHVQLHDIA